MRTFALASAWKEAGHDWTFLSAPGSEGSAEALTGIAPVPTAGEPGDDTDLEATLGHIRELRPDILVLDGYSFGPRFQAAVRSQAPVVMIDDHAHHPGYSADAIVDHNLDASADMYADRTDARLLLGPKFALLRPAFSKERGQADPPGEGPPRVLVTMGSADPTGSLITVLDGLEVITISMEIDVVTTSGNPRIADLEARLSSLSHRGHLHLDVRDPHVIMRTSDVAVTAAGTTCLELACMGLAFVTVVCADNQARVATAWSKIGLAPNVGRAGSFTPQDVVAALSPLLEDESLRKERGDMGRALVDGQGARRVVEHMVEVVERNDKDG